MADVTPELLKKAFIDPIRFALLVDDEFPSYRDLANDEAASKRARDSRVLELLALCRDRGWLCDVESDLEVIRKSGPHLSQSNLAIVDFHLDPARESDATAALRLLQRLAASSHFNLAVVYTGSEVADVALDLAFALGGGGAMPAGKFRRTGEEQLAELEAHEEVSASNPVLRAMVGGKYGAKPLQDQVARWTGYLGKSPREAIKVQFANYFEKRLTAEVLEARPADVEVEFDATAQVPWVSVDNLFVAVVSKDKVPAAEIVDCLGEALVAWAPPALKVLMVHARAELEKAGSRHDLSVLHSELRQAGWLYNVFSAEADDRPKRIGQLHSHLFEGMASELQNSVGEFGRELFAPAGMEEPLKNAKAWGRLPTDTADALVLHAANEFLSSHACDADGRLTTGLIFQEKAKSARQLWICTTPSCDLVPGQNELGWDAQLEPYKVVYAARLQQAPKDEFEGRVRQAHNGRHLYLTVGKERLAFEVSSEASRQARLEVLLVKDQGVYKDGRFEGRVIRLGEGGPELKPMHFEVVAQLRPGFANKFLMDAGMQKARIGLSWAAPVPVPLDEAGEAAAEAAPAQAEPIVVPQALTTQAPNPITPFVSDGEEMPEAHE